MILPDSQFLVESFSDWDPDEDEDDDEEEEDEGDQSWKLCSASPWQIFRLNRRSSFTDSGSRKVSVSTFLLNIRSNLSSNILIFYIMRLYNIYVLEACDLTSHESMFVSASRVEQLLLWTVNISIPMFNVVSRTHSNVSSALPLVITPWTLIPPTYPQ